MSPTRYSNDGDNSPVLPSKKAKINKTSITDEIIEQAWAHYRSYLDSENEIEDEEAANIDELYEIIELLSDTVNVRKQDVSIQSLPKFSLTKDSFGSIRSLLHVLLSMVHLHLGNELISNSFENSNTTEIESNPVFHLEKSIQYFPFNASTLSILANYKRMNLNDTPENICYLYEHSSINARLIRELAINILDEDSMNTEEAYKEWIELLLLDGITGAEYIGNDDEGSENDESTDNSHDSNDHNVDKDHDSEYSTSDVEAVSSFMAAMLNSTLGRHDEAKRQLKKFNVSHRIHPNVWEYAMGGFNHNETGNFSGKDYLSLSFEPKAFKGNILPQETYNRLCDIFRPSGAYWKESDYQNRGYYSYFNDLSIDTLSRPTHIVEDIVVNYLLPLIKMENTIDTKEIVGFEWWIHTRPLSANLGHQLHFDTDEALLEQKKELTHPLVSSVLYLTGNKSEKQQTAGSTIVFNQKPDSTEVASKAFVMHALDNSYMIFPGDALHGVLPCPCSRHQSESKDTTERLTLMVGFWTRRVPDNIKHQSLYSPCGPLPPDSDEHTWVKEIKDGYPKQKSSDSDYSTKSSVNVSILPHVTPAWECINIDHDKGLNNNSTSLPIPCSLDHRFFVNGAPTCFRDSLFKDESFS